MICKVMSRLRDLMSSACSCDVKPSKTATSTSMSFSVVAAAKRRFDTLPTELSDTIRLVESNFQPLLAASINTKRGTLCWMIILSLLSAKNDC